MTKVIGLTGSIAVGKSTVTHYLLTHGYQVIDADEISRHALDKGKPCYDQVIEVFGCLDESGNIDRKALGDIVFHNSQRKKQLEAIVHPYVIEQLKLGIQQCQESLVFLDIPLLFEIHLDSLCDKIIVVYVDEQTQMKRLMKRNGITQEEAKVLMSQQISIEKKRFMGDYVLDNCKDYQYLYEDIERVLKVLRDEIIYE